MYCLNDGVMVAASKSASLPESSEPDASISCSDTVSGSTFSHRERVGTAPLTDTSRMPLFLRMQAWSRTEQREQNSANRAKVAWIPPVGSFAANYFATDTVGLQVPQVDVQQQALCPRSMVNSPSCVWLP